MALKKYTLPHGEGSFYQRAADGRWIGTIEAGWTARGTRRRITVSDKDKARAWNKLSAKRKELAKEGLTPEGVRAGMTVAAWLETWLATRARVVRPKTFQSESSALTRWVIPILGRKRLASLGPQDMRKLTEKMIDDGKSTTHARLTQRVFTQALKDAVVEGHAVPQRVLLAPRPKMASSNRGAIPLDEAIRILDVARSGDDAARWVAALLQGMRQGECLGLTWECVDLDRGTIDVSWQLQGLRYADREKETFKTPDAYEARRLDGSFHLVRPKTSRGHRLIPITPWMHAQLEAARPQGATGLVWMRPDGRPRSASADRKAWKALQDAAGVRKPDGSHYVLHEARHTTATLLLAAGVDPEVIKAILGHSSIITTRGYQHVDLSMSRKALEGLASTLTLD